MTKEETKQFLETLHFHGYIDCDITKLYGLVDNYYPEQLTVENVQLKAEREWISVEDLKEAFYEGQDGRYTEFDNWYFEYRKPHTP